MAQPESPERAGDPHDVRSDAIALAAGLVTVTLWGSAFVGIRAAGAQLSPGSIALGRLLVSTVILGGVAVVRRDPLPRRRDIALIAVYGVLWLGVYSVSLNAAEHIVDAGTAALLVNTGPILVAVLAGVFLHEGFPRQLFTGIAIAFAGCAMIGFATSQSRTNAGIGILLLAVAVVSYSIALVVQKRVLAHVHPFQVTLIGVLAALLACLPFVPSLMSEVVRSSPGALAWTVYLGAFPTAIGFATWSFALRRTDAGRLGTLTYLAPVIAVLLGWLILGETPPPLAIAGGILGVVGVYISGRVPASRKSRPASSSVAPLNVVPARRE